MLKTIRLLLFSLIISLASAAAFSQENRDLAPDTLGWVNIDTDSLVGLDLHMPIAEHLFGLLPELHGQWGFGNFAVGADVGLSYYVQDPNGYYVLDRRENEFRFGDVGVYGKGAKCFGEKHSICIGGKLEVAITPGDISNSDRFDPLFRGILSHLRFNRFGPESVIISPTLVASIKKSIFFLHMHAGPELVVPYGDPDDKLGDWGLNYGLAAGARPNAQYSMGIGVRGLAWFYNRVDLLHAVDLFIRWYVGMVEPSLMFSFLADPDFFEMVPFVLSVGATVRF